MREYLLSSGQGYTSLILDALLYHGIKPGQHFTARQALEITELPHHILNSGLKNPILSRRRRRTARKGRPEYIYSMPYIDHMLKTWELHISPSDELKKADLANLKAYRVALHRELINRGFQKKKEPKQFSRKYLASRLGVVAQTLRNYEKQLKTWVHAVFSKIVIDRKWLFLVPKDGREGLYVEVTAWNGKTSRFPAKRGLIAKLMHDKFGDGDAVYTLIEQKPNLYAPTRPPLSFFTRKYI